MAKVLILGGAGFIGSRLSRKLMNEGHNVAIIDNFLQYSAPLSVNYSAALAYRKQLLEGAVIFRGDVTVSYDIIRCLNTFQPEYIIHLTALTRADINDANITNAFQTSLLPILHLSEYYRDKVAQIKRILYVSSSYVYGNFLRNYCCEDDEKKPTSTYGGVKYACEVLLSAWCRRFDIPYTIIRPIAAYGPGDLNGKLSMQNIKTAIDKRELIIMGDLNELSDYTYVDDLVEGITLATFSEKAIGETFNISSGKGIKLSELIAAFNTIGYDIHPVKAPVNQSRPRRGYLDITKAEAILGYHPAIEIEAGLLKCIEYINKYDILMR